MSIRAVSSHLIFLVESANMSKQSSITAFCVKGLVPTRQPPTKKRRAEPLPKRRPGRPRKRPCLQVAQEPANVHHDLSDAMKMVDDYHHELEKYIYFSRLYLDSLESGLMVEHRIKKPRATYSNELRFACAYVVGQSTSTRTRSTVRL